MRILLVEDDSLLGDGIRAGRRRACYDEAVVAKLRRQLSWPQRSVPTGRIRLA